MGTIKKDYPFTFLDKGRTVTSKRTGREYIIGGVTNYGLYLVDVNGTPDTNKHYYFVVNETPYSMRKTYCWGKK